MRVRDWGIEAWFDPRQGELPENDRLLRLMLLAERILPIAAGAMLVAATVALCVFAFVL
ncbi:MAG: hypothetical protein IRZ13_03810 [Acetobacteraceae bacterium]|jgi:hypothetical protein|nr:hypothetical protein [Acetobacteraceae bacterium]